MYNLHVSLESDQRQIDTRHHEGKQNKTVAQEQNAQCIHRCFVLPITSQRQEFHTVRYNYEETAQQVCKHLIYDQNMGCAIPHRLPHQGCEHQTVRQEPNPTDTQGKPKKYFHVCRIGPPAFWDRLNFCCLPSIIPVLVSIDRCCFHACRALLDSRVESIFNL